MAALGKIIDRTSQHLALFYDDTYPADEVSDFFAAGLAAGDGCVALLTVPHRDAVELCLRSRGVDPEQVAYCAVDTGSVLAHCLVDGRLDLDRASALLTPLLTPPVNCSKGRVRAAGDLAPTLIAAGQADDAVAFEALVHRLTLELGATVICPYPIDAVFDHGNLRALMRVSAEHARLDFPKRIWIKDLVAAAPAAAVAS